MKNLIENLKQLSMYGIIGMKQSFEDEGVLLDDVITVKRITELCDLPTFVKIGGCEAKTDINNCIRLGIDNIIAPMVETPFALSKFIHCVPENENINLYLIQLNFRFDKLEIDKSIKWSYYNKKWIYSRRILLPNGEPANMPYE